MVICALRKIRSKQYSSFNNDLIEQIDVILNKTQRIYFNNISELGCTTNTTTTAATTNNYHTDNKYFLENECDLNYKYINDDFIANDNDENDGNDNNIL
jgi:hypothetical protein